MTKPTVQQIEAWSQVDFATLGVSEQAALQVLIDRAWSWLGWVTGIALDAVGDDYAPTGMAIKPLIEQAIQAKVEALAYQGAPEIIETAADFMLIQSFSAGSYSESRRSLSDLKLAGMIDADPRINALLWPLLTDEKRDDWLAWLSGKNAPAFEVTEIAWDADPYGIPSDVILETEPWSTYF